MKHENSFCYPSLREVLNKIAICVILEVILAD